MIFYEDNTAEIKLGIYKYKLHAVILIFALLHLFDPELN